MKIVFELLLILVSLAYFSCGQLSADNRYGIDPKLGFSTGPNIGEKVPEFSLPDQHGNVRSLNQLLGKNGALIYFFSSASFCPNCKLELVEYQKKINEFKAKGLSVIGISFDPVDVVKSFSHENNITFPLLSDARSKVIRKYGIVLQGIPLDNRWYGVPHPGIYIIDKNLVVLEKHFEKSPDERATVENVLVTYLNKEIKTNKKTFSTSYLEGSIAISDTVALSSQVLAIIVKMSVKDGVHLYGEPIPAGYYPLRIQLEPNPNFTLGPWHYPKTKKLVLESINETFNILPNDFELRSKIRIANRPKPGSHVITVKMSFQACDSKMCMIPKELVFEFPLEIKGSAAEEIGKEAGIERRGSVTKQTH
jgi:peroxiredoxin